jgi:predicted hotdog family 3-hydroxylacyl-ACP dehydratase
MNLPEISTLVPHDGTMLLLERVLAADAETLCAELTIRPDTLFCDGLGVGAWVGIEYMAQAIAAHAGQLALARGMPVKLGFLLGSRRYQCSVPLFAIGTTLQVKVQQALKGDNGFSAFDCRIEDAANNAVLATATVTVFQPDNVDHFLQRSTT